MKKFYLVSVLSLALGFTACGDDDDSSSSSDDDGCVTCTTTVSGQSVDNKICEDADGVVTIDGVEAEGFTVETAKLTYTLSGGTCK